MGTAEVHASISLDIRQPQYSLNSDSDDPVFRFVTRLTVRGTVTHPQTRAGNEFAITMCGDDAPSSGVFTKAKDVQARSPTGVAQYREYRGRQLPVTNRPRVSGLLEKRRGELMWTARLNLAPRAVTDMLTLLALQKPLYLAISERREKLCTWVHSIGAANDGSGRRMI